MLPTTSNRIRTSSATLTIPASDSGVIPYLELAGDADLAGLEPGHRHRDGDLRRSPVQRERAAHDELGRAARLDRGGVKRDLGVPGGVEHPRAEHLGLELADRLLARPRGQAGELQRARGVDLEIAHRDPDVDGRAAHVNGVVRDADRPLRRHDRVTVPEEAEQSRPLRHRHEVGTLAIDLHVRRRQDGRHQEQGGHDAEHRRRVSAGGSGHDVTILPTHAGALTVPLSLAAIAVRRAI
jgi:hypothetical protein